MEPLNVTPYLAMDVEKLKKEYFKLSRPYRRALYEVLPDDKKAVIRPLAEARRGIVRDERGRIVRSKDWLKERIAFLEAKQADMENRIKNIKAEIKYRTLELKDGKGAKE